MFHHDNSGKAKFGQRPSPEAKPSEQKPMQPHDAHSAPEHVTKTHPGTTQPHPATGVHAVHVHHVGKGKSGGPDYESHTHHDDGTVEKNDHANEEDMKDHMDNALPSQQADGSDSEPEMRGGDADDMGLSSIGEDENA